MRTLAIAVLMSAISILPASGQQAGRSVEVPAGAHRVLEARGEGVQVYACTEADGGFKWVLKGPDARLLDRAGRQIGRHFAGPTWQLTDGSQVVGELMASQPSPDAGAVAWLLLRAKSGSATGRLADVSFIRRTATHGGVADSSGCRASGDAGKMARVPYWAMYTFYSEQ